MTDREKFIALVDNDRVKPSDAIILLEGDGLNRANKAGCLFAQGMAKKIVFSGGIDNPNYGSFTAEKVLPELYKLGVIKEAIILDEKSQNTHDQAIEIVAMMCQMGWKRIILVASHYHQYRAYLTFLKVVQEVGHDLIIYNAPANDLPWFSDDGWGKRIDLLEREFMKIDEYTKLGHIASFEFAVEYQRWKELKSY